MNNKALIEKIKSLNEHSYLKLCDALQFQNEPFLRIHENYFIRNCDAIEGLNYEEEELYYRLQSTSILAAKRYGEFFGYDESFPQRDSMSKGAIRSSFQSLTEYYDDDDDLEEKCEYLVDELSEYINKSIANFRLQAVPIVLLNSKAKFEKPAGSTPLYKKTDFKNISDIQQYHYCSRGDIHIYVSKRSLFIHNNNVLASFLIINRGWSTELNITRKGLLLEKDGHELTLLMCYPSIIPTLYDEDDDLPNPELKTSRLSFLAESEELKRQYYDSIQVVKFVDNEGFKVSRIDFHSPYFAHRTTETLASIVSSSRDIEIPSELGRTLHFAVVKHSFNEGDYALIMEDEKGPYNSFAIFNLNERQLYHGYRSSVLGISAYDIRNQVLAQVIKVEPYKCRLTPFTDVKVSGIKIHLSKPINSFRGTMRGLEQIAERFDNEF